MFVLEAEIVLETLLLGDVESDELGVEDRLREILVDAVVDTETVAELEYVILRLEVRLVEPVEVSLLLALVEPVVE